MIVTILLVILLAIAAFIMLVLFLPVRYKADGKIEGKLNLRLYIDWFFHAVGIILLVKDNEPVVIIRIFGKKKRLKKKDGTTEKKKDKKQEKNKDGQQQPTGIAEKAKTVFSFFADEENRELLAFIIEKIKKLISRIMPDTIRTRFSFALSDPAATGLATAAVSIVPFVYQYDIGLYPDFESEAAYIKGTFHVDGSIRPVYPAATFISLFSKKRFRELIKRYRRRK